MAWEAAHTNHKDVLVAGCLPPLTLAYANVDTEEAELQQPIYNQIVEALLPNVDLFLCETMATEAQTWAAASAASASGKPFWVCTQNALASPLLGILTSKHSLPGCKQLRTVLADGAPVHACFTRSADSLR